MFFKINPRVASKTYALNQYGYIQNDVIMVQLKGDFRPSDNPDDVTYYKDAFQNTSFDTGMENKFWASPNPAQATLVNNSITAINSDSPLGDNSDPDGDYGFEIQLLGFTKFGDYFDFNGRKKIPDIYQNKSIYNSGAGGDEIYFSSKEIIGFDNTKKFFTEAGNDTVYAAAKSLTLDMGADFDTFIMTKSATISWKDEENQDKDSTVLLRSGNQEFLVSNAEKLILSNGWTGPAIKWYLQIDRELDGKCTVEFFANDKSITGKVAASYDEATPIAENTYRAYFKRGGDLGERIELMGTTPRTGIDVHKGTNGGNSEGCFVPGDKGEFLKKLFAHVEKAYADTGFAMEWNDNFNYPKIPMTVNVEGKVPQPKLNLHDVTIDTKDKAAGSAKFTLDFDGQVSGLDRKGLQLFFTVDDHSYLRGHQWDFGSAPVALEAGLVPKVGKIYQMKGHADVFSVFLGPNSDSVKIPILLHGDKITKSDDIDIVLEDVSLWRYRDNIGGGKQWLEFHESKSSHYEFADAEKLVAPDLSLEMHIISHTKSVADNIWG